MNKRNKIIVSIVGITIVLLALLGITYAYYLTRIEGNTNTNSISVTTAKLELIYGDNSAEIIEGTGALTPSTDLNSAGAIGTKTFTVTNNGNDSSYVVIIDNVSVTKVSDGSVTTFVSNDFRYTLSCKKSDNTDCNDVSDLTIFPIKGGILVSNDIEEDDVHTYTLTMWYIDTGIDQSDDMGKSLQARVNIADVAQMENPFKTGVTATDNASLAYNIINNAKENKNGTELLNTSSTKVAEEKSYTKGTGKMIEQELNLSGKTWSYGTTDINARPWNGGSMEGSVLTCSDIIVNKYISYPTVGESWYVKSCKSETVAIVEAEEMEYESSIQTAQDDLGTSYYYRGAVDDNYVTFADMCWRIVRINGDGTIKLILEDQDQPCSEDINGNWDIPTTTGGTTKIGNFGYTSYSSDTLTASDGTQNSGTKYIMDYLHGETKSAISMATAFKNFQSTFTATELSKLKAGNWCLADKAYTRSGSYPNFTYTLLNKTQIMDNKIKAREFYYDSLVRLNNYLIKEPTLKCNGTIMNDWDDDANNPTPMYVGAITADEIVYAGGKVSESNLNYYLINNYQNTNLKSFWSLSPYGLSGAYDCAFDVYYHGKLSYDKVDCDHESENVAFRPSVSLASGAVISSGEGTLEKPYVIG